MRDILARASEPALATFVTERTLFAFDFDGTLAPLVRHPAEAVMRASTRRLLSHLAAQVRCVVISGRRRADAQRHLRGIPLAAVIGNHGAETTCGALPAPRVGVWRDAIAAKLDLPGMWIEHKGASLTVHYRAAASPSSARAAIWRAAARLRGARVFDGSAAVNIVPRDSPHKGQALESLCRRLGCDQAIFVGDDVTDEDAFGATPGCLVMGIRVGWSHASRAPYFIRGQASVDKLLARVLALLGASPRHHGRPRVPRARRSVP